MTALSFANVAVDRLGVRAEAGAVGLRERERDRPGLVGERRVLPGDGLGSLAVGREPVGAEQRRDRRAHRAGEPRIGLGRVPRVDREPLTELLAAFGGRLGEPLDLGPRPLGVHVVGRDGRDAAPIVDARVEEPEPLRLVRQVRGRLHAHVRPHHDPRDRDGREERLVGGLGRAGHRGARLRPEVLDDHLLDVVVAPVEVADRDERRRALA